MSGLAWYEAEFALDSDRRKASRLALGDEQTVFADVMERYAAMLEGFFDDGLVYDDPTKAKFSVAHSAFALLWASWSELVADRVVAAQSHWRSIHEAPDFLRAIDASPDLGRAFFRGKAKVEAARRAIRKERLKGEARAEKLRWEDHRKSMDSFTNPLSHVTWESSVVTVPLDAGGEENGPLIYRRRGASPSDMRSACLMLAAQALIVYHTCLEVFADRPSVAKRAEVDKEMLSECGDILDQILRESDSGEREAPSDTG